MIRRLVIFGASGDLTGRFLLPALAQLASTGELADDFTVLGVAPHDWDDETFRRHTAERLDLHGTDVPAGVREALLGRLRYRTADVTDGTSVRAALASARDGGASGEPLAVYLALPTGLIRQAIRAAAAAGLPPKSRIAVEKPFGENAQDAKDLNALLAEALGADREEAAFRVDHVLGMDPVQNLLPLRFANRIPEALWNSEHIEEVEVLWEETLALEGRAAYYDRAGALRDVLQNHLMQVLCLATMESPGGLESSPGDMFPAQAVRQRKLELLRSVHDLSTADVVRSSRRARYVAGRLADGGGADGRSVPDYTAEDGVDPGRTTETFAEVVLTIDNERWSGTRFRLRAGKALAERRKGIRVRFRPTSTRRSHDAGTPESAYGQRFWIGVDGPNDLALSFNGLTLSAPQPQAALTPYARVLRNLLQGKSDLSIGAEESEQAWRILTPVREAWDQNLVPLLDYAAGSDGPATR